MDEIEVLHTEPAITFCVRDDEPQIGFDQTGERRFVAIALDPRADLAFFFCGQPRESGDFAQVGRQRAAVVASGRVPAGHGSECREKTEKLELRTENYFLCALTKSVGEDFTSAVDSRCSQSSMPRVISCFTYSMNSLTSPCICSILRRMLRMISTPARLTPRSRVSDRIVSSCSRSSSEYNRVLPSVREGFSNPSRSYKRSVCGWMLYFCATALIM